MMIPRRFVLARFSRIKMHGAASEEDCALAYI
jgi:hypothetical protein